MSLILKAAYFALDRGGVKYLIATHLLLYSLISTRVRSVIMSCWTQLRRYSKVPWYRRYLANSAYPSLL